jgi:hypothetical protein
MPLNIHILSRPAKMPEPMRSKMIVICLRADVNASKNNFSADLVRDVILT